MSSFRVIAASTEGQNHLFPRKGGGGKGGGAKSGGKGSKGSSTSRASSAAKKHGASDTFVKSRGGRPFTVTGGGSGSTAYAYSDGGGKHVLLSAGSSFSGREAGGGTRSTIYGTSRFGSGYPYGSYGSYVDSRPVPYYFYPVPVSHGYYGGDEYLNVYDRPGGSLMTAIVQPSYNTSSVTYRIVGDDSSVISAFDALVTNCSVVNSTSVFTRFEPSNTTWPLPEQVVQYYRASSFALSLDGYNNTASLPANAPASNNSSPVQMADTPLPSGLNGTFLQCLNHTIGASVPLVETSKKGLSSRDIAQIVAGSIVGVILIIFCGAVCCNRRFWRKRKDKLVKKLGDTPKIRVIGSSDAKSSGKSSQFTTKDPIEKDTESTSRLVSMDGHTLVADPFGRKDRWSYASSSASSSAHVNDNIEGNSLKKMEKQPSAQTAHNNHPDSNEGKSSWLSKMPFPGHFGYRSVKHQSTSSIELPLTQPSPRHSHDLSSDIATLSPAHSWSSSRSPSPSPTNVRFPLMHAEEKRPLG